VLAAADPRDPAVEHLRSLRTSLQFALVEARNNVVAISGPGPGVGKSFVCANLAYVLATPERRVLLVDCDLRRGQLHRYFAVDRRPGVSDVVSGAVEIAQAIRTTDNAGLDVLPSGRIPPNPAELLSSQAFEQLLGWASRRYGFVLVDTPPVLAVTDPAVVARLAGVNLLVLRAGEHPIREIALTVKRLTQSGVRVNGAVLNDARSTAGRHGKYGRYASYEYSSAEPE
jgi:tyrosine-protein kinase Etk/Wzc